MDGGSDASQRVTLIFDAALDQDPEERDAYVRGACKGDPALEAEVRALLDAQGAVNEGAFLAEPTRAMPADQSGVDAPTMPSNAALQGGSSDPQADGGSSGGAMPGTSLGEGPGSVIGRYKLLQLIGEGGFGSVFMAEQTQPVKRRVALKIVKAGMDTKQVLARFEAERQALAMMDHPNIARVLDAGATDRGRPFFVMELVKGEAITAYCDRHNLSVQDRLDLFRDVCAAVQHAHTKGVIHRDIKPSNILVTVADGKPLPKVIDFGIAKATHGSLTDKTLFTEFRQLIGTPAYMSPEQAEMSSADIDTRTDVYSLGVLLYELLTGTTPLDPKQMMSAGLAEIHRYIREHEPARPSTKLSTMGSLDEAAARRHTPPQRLGALIRGNLDWIVMKCLEKDRTRRYDTASGLAADIGRHLRHEAVEACPPSAAYRLRTFVRRNRAGVVTAAMVAGALLLGTIGTTAGLIWALKERDIAREQRDQTAVERDRANQTRDLIQQMLSSIDPAVALNRDTTLLREILDQQRDRLKTDPIEHPLVEADLCLTLGDAYLAIGMPAEAEPLLKTAVDLRTRELGADDPGTLEAEQSLGKLRRAQGLVDVARQIFQSVAERRAKILGQDHPQTLTSRHDLAGTLLELGRHTEGGLLIFDVATRRSEVLGEFHEDTKDSQLLAINMQRDYWKSPRAEEIFDQAVGWSQDRFGPYHPRTLALICGHGELLARQQEFGRAQALLQSTLASSFEVLGPAHPDTLVVAQELGSLCLQANELAAAEELLNYTLTHRQELLEPGRPAIDETRILLGRLYIAQEKFDAAETTLRAASEGLSQSYGPQHPHTLVALSHLARTLDRQSRLDEALPLFARVYDGCRTALTDLHPNTITALTHWADALARSGEPAEALDLFRRALKQAEAVHDLGEDTDEEARRRQVIRQRIAQLAGPVT